MLFDYTTNALGYLSEPSVSKKKKVLMPSVPSRKDKNSFELVAMLVVKIHNNFVLLQRDRVYYNWFLIFQ